MSNSLVTNRIGFKQGLLLGLLALSAFSLDAGQKYAVVSGVFQASENCLFFLTKIYDVGPDGERGGGDDFQYASGIIKGDGCEDELAPAPSAFSTTSAYNAVLGGLSTENNCEYFELTILEGNTTKARGTIERCQSFKKGPNPSLSPIPVKRLSFNYTLEIFPSIAKNRISIRNYYHLTEVEVYTLDGRLVKSIRLNSESEDTELDISEFESGWYLLKSQEAGKSYSGKFLKQ